MSFNALHETTAHQIDLWKTESREHQRLEFKEAKTTFDKHKLNEYCVAIANEGGGNLVLGVTDKIPRKVVGTKAFPNAVSIAEELFIKLGFRMDVEEVQHPDGRILIFHIPSRPRGTAYHLDGKYLMRSGESLVPMSEDALRTIFSEGKPDWLEGYSKSGLDAQQVIELLDVQTFFELLKSPYPTTRDGVLERLINEQLVDELKGSFSIRRLGALLLAKRFTDFPDVLRKAPRVVVYSGISKTQTRLDHTETAGYAVGFRSLIRFIMDHLPQNEAIKDALRVNLKLVPEIVVRELVANALIHQDMTLTGVSVMIEIYENRLEISNPGEPIVPLDRFIDGYESRNERLAALMRRMGICEEKGSGIDKLIDAVEQFQLPAPDFRVGHRRTSVLIHGHKMFEEMDRSEKIRACYQHCALKWVMSQAMTNQTLRERFGLPEGKSATISHVITATLDEKLIKADEKVGTARKMARYLPFWA